MLRQLFTSVVVAIAVLGCTEVTDPLEQDALVVVNGTRITAAYVRDRILLSEQSQHLRSRGKWRGEERKNRLIPSVYARSIQEELLDQEIVRRGIMRTPRSDQKALKNSLKRTKKKDLTLNEVAALYGPLERRFRVQFDRESRRIAFFDTLTDLEPTPVELYEYYNNLSNTIRVVKKNNATAEEKATKVIAELRSGAQWNDVATRYSEDKLEDEKHKAYATEWDTFTLDNCNLEPVKKALAGARQGFISKPLDTEEGLLIVKVNSVTNGEYNCARIMLRMMDAPQIPSLKDANARLKNEKFNDMLRSLITELRAKAKMEFPYGTNFVYKIWKDPEPRRNERSRAKKTKDTKETAK